MEPEKSAEAGCRIGGSPGPDSLREEVCECNDGRDQAVECVVRSASTGDLLQRSVCESNV
ncbi:unnamed protein product [Dovyalis caffra]|uniref:Uncharacterized protein n=1 Tax=Dovyalis caffra TaxID=77055 RepID=A0AAV1SIA9_9ROSI|nr:unnamed protein product [Dovyalis caffra]